MLTAAHCVHDTERNTVNVPGVLRVSTKDALVASEDFLDLEVEDVHVMSNWLDSCQPPCGARKARRSVSSHHRPSALHAPEGSAASIPSRS